MVAPVERGVARGGHPLGAAGESDAVEVVAGGLVRRVDDLVAGEGAPGDAVEDDAVAPVPAEHVAGDRQFVGVLDPDGVVLTLEGSTAREQDAVALEWTW